MSYETETETTDVNIKELKPYHNRFNVAFKVISKGEEREVSNRNNPDETHRISDIIVADQTGSIIISAWDDDIDLLEEGKGFTLNNGFVNVFRDSMRLARGKFGNFEETDASFEVNTEVNRSDEVHERRQRRRSYDSDRGGNRGYNSNQGQSNYRRW
ncbi:MAG: single-stranded DNA-binding protein [Candidatus Hodarchaeales archaeon]|jgi:replication factor A1